MTNAKPLVIAGASYAGVQLAATARELGFAERIILVGEEGHLPYQRPPLSKGVLTGKTTLDQLPLRGPGFYEENGIELMLGRRANALDLHARRVALDDGSTLDYGWLALATGARCRPVALPGVDLEGVFNLRTLDDALRARGIAVTVIEAQPRLLMRAFPLRMSEYIEDAHRSRGTEVLTGRGVRALHGVQGRVSAVELDDGARIDCDLVVFGIGVLPNVELARDAGLAVDNGIVVDMLGRSSTPQVLAVGDVANMARPPAPGEPARARLESIQAANDGAKAAASLLVGHAQPCTAVPWFWSDQFNLKFQMAGLPQSGDQAVLRGDMAGDRFSCFYLRNGVLVAAHSVNKPSDHIQSRKLIAAGARLSAEQLADESFDLRKVPIAALDPAAA